MKVTLPGDNLFGVPLKLRTAGEDKIPLLGVDMLLLGVNTPFTGVLVLLGGPDLTGVQILLRGLALISKDTSFSSPVISLLFEEETSDSPDDMRFLRAPSRFGVRFFGEAVEFSLTYLFLGEGVPLTGEEKNLAGVIFVFGVSCAFCGVAFSGVTFVLFVGDMIILLPLGDFPASFKHFLVSFGEVSGDIDSFAFFMV